MKKLRFWLAFSHHAFSQSTRHKCTACPFFSSLAAIWRTQRLATCSCTLCRRSFAARQHHFFSRMTCPACKQNKRDSNGTNKSMKQMKKFLLWDKNKHNWCDPHALSCLLLRNLLGRFLRPRIFPLLLLPLLSHRRPTNWQIDSEVFIYYQIKMIYWIN